MNHEKKLPLVYSCSGASSAAQMANHIAVRMDRLKVAEMSCIAGVGGDVKPLVRTAKSGRPIIALDGCPLHCAAQILKRHGLKADKHYDLSKMGVKKIYHQDFDPHEATQRLEEILKDSGLFREPNSTATPLTAKPSSDPTQKPNSQAASDDDEGETREPSSPVCYLREFERF